MSTLREHIVNLKTLHPDRHARWGTYCNEVDLLLSAHMDELMALSEAWIEEELKDGDRICEAAGVQRTEGGRLPVAKIINRLKSVSPAVTAQKP